MRSKAGYASSLKTWVPVNAVGGPSTRWARLAATHSLAFSCDAFAPSSVSKSEMVAIELLPESMIL